MAEGAATTSGSQAAKSRQARLTFLPFFGDELGKANHSSTQFR
jgi:hypothetical protein